MGFGQLVRQNMHLIILNKVFLPFTGEFIVISDKLIEKTQCSVVYSADVHTEP